MITPSIIGGAMMLLGSFFTYRGDIYNALRSYVIADICWIVASFISKDYMGMAIVTVATVVSLVVAAKMNRGLFYKTVRKS